MEADSADSAVDSEADSAGKDTAEVSDTDIVITDLKDKNQKNLAPSNFVQIYF